MCPPGYCLHLHARRIAHERHLVDDQARGHERARQVVPAVHDQHLQFRIDRDRLAQLLHRAALFLVAAIPGLVHFVAQRVVASVVVPAHRARDEVDHRGRRRRDDRVEQRIVRALFRRERKRIPLADVRIVAAAELAFVAIDLAQVGLRLEAAAGATHERRIEPGQFGHALDDAIERLRIGAALEDVGDVVAARVVDDLAHRGVGELALALEVRGRDARQREHPRQRREVAVVFGGRIEIRRDEHDAVHRDAEPGLQEVRDARPAESAVAFADEILARHQAVILHEPVVDDARQILDVGLGRVEVLLRFVFGDARTAETRAHRIDEHEVGEVEPGPGIVDRRRRVGRAVAFRAELHALRSERAEVEVDRRGARAAVERERHGAVCTGHRVGDEHDVGDRLALLVEHGQRTDGRVVGNRLAADRRRLTHGLVGRKRRQLGLVTLAGLLGIFGRGLGVVGSAKRRAREQGDQQTRCERGGEFGHEAPGRMDGDRRA